MIRVAAALLVAVLGAVFAAAGIADAQDRRASRAAGPVVKIEKGEACVAPTDEMRRDHTKFLLHQRDRTVRQGQREPRFSLKGCVECHASQQTGSVLGKDGFCASCHEFVAVKMDCFECHTPLRQSRAAGGPR